MGAIRPILVGMLILLVGTIPRNLLFLANLRVLASVPWAVPVTAVYLWLFWMAVAALYGTVTALTDSILPAMVLHTTGNLYSNFDRWLHGRSDWQAPANQSPLVWSTGADTAFWQSLAWFVLTTAALVWAMVRLARSARRNSRSGAVSAVP